MKLSLIVSALALSMATGGVLADQEMPMHEQMEEEMPMQGQMEEEMPMQGQMPMQKQMSNKGQMHKQDKELIYGSQLMTQQERIEYREKMRAAATAQEREQIRNEHHQLMKARAQEQGVTLPDEPPAGGAMRGNGMGTGKGNKY